MKKILSSLWITALAVMTVAFIVIPVWEYHRYFSDFPVIADISKWGSFGDYFSGTVATGLTLVTVILVWATYHSQRKELEAQKIVLSRQTEIMEKQTFEQTYFSWVGFIKEIPVDIDAEKLFKIFREGPKSYFNDIVSFAKNENESENYRSQLDAHIKEFIASIPEIYIHNKREGQKESWIEQNLKNLEAIVRFIDRADKYPKSFDEKSIYFNILTAQYSVFQRYILGLEALAADTDIVPILAAHNFFDFKEIYPLQKILERKLNGTLTFEYLEQEINERLRQQPPQPNPVTHSVAE